MMPVQSAPVDVASPPIVGETGNTWTAPEFVPFLEAEMGLDVDPIHDARPPSGDPLEDAEADSSNPPDTPAGMASAPSGSPVHPPFSFLSGTDSAMNIDPTGMAASATRVGSRDEAPLLNDSGDEAVSDGDSSGPGPDASRVAPSLEAAGQLKSALFGPAGEAPDTEVPDSVDTPGARAVAARRGSQSIAPGGQPEIGSPDDPSGEFPQTDGFSDDAAMSPDDLSGASGRSEPVDAREVGAGVNGAGETAESAKPDAFGPRPGPERDESEHVGARNLAEAGGEDASDAFGDSGSDHSERALTDLTPRDAQGSPKSETSGGREVFSDALAGARGSGSGEASAEAARVLPQTPQVELVRPEVLKSGGSGEMSPDPLAAMDSAELPAEAVAFEAADLRQEHVGEEVRIRLNSGLLGRLELRASSTGSGVIEATIGAVRPEVQEILRRELPSLEQSLERRELPVEKVSVLEGLELRSDREGGGSGASGDNDRLQEEAPGSSETPADNISTTGEETHPVPRNGRLDLRV